MATGGIARRAHAAGDAPPTAAPGTTPVPSADTRSDHAPLVVHGDRSLPPYEFIEDGVAKGLNVDVFNELGKRLGRSVDYRLGDWGESQAAVLEGRGDVLPPIVSTAARRSVYNFTRTLFTYDFALFAREADVGRVAPADRSTLRIGVTQAGFARQFFVDRYPSARLVIVSDAVDGVRRLQRREIDAYAGNSLAAEAFLRDLRIHGIEQVGEPFASLEAGIAVHRRNPDLHAALDAAVAELKADGTIERLIDRWKGGDTVELSRSQVWGMAAAGVGATVVAALGTMVLMQRRRAQVLEAEVAQRRRTEAMLEAARAEAESARAAAEDAARAKSTFLANMSHEIRTPMNAIVGLSRLIRRSPDAQAANVERLRKIDSAAQHLSALVSDVLDHSKIEAGKLTLDDAEFSLSALLQSVSSNIAVLAEQKGVSVVVECLADETWFVGDPTRLRQALINLAANAAKFTTEGRIVIRGQVVDQSESTATLRFEVDDTGPGVDPGMAQRLFEPFEQASAAVARRHGGTGLGLSITRRLAQLMGGEVGFDSQIGQGSRFWFTAQVRRGRGAQNPAPSVDGKRSSALLRERHRGARVLVAEDNPVNLEVTTALLEDVGLTVLTARDGREAVEVVASTPVDLILMDMQMPEMDGMAATIEIRSRWPDSPLPILALTANAFDEDRRACLMVGMNGFATKPLDPDVLYDLLLKWLGPRDPLATASPVAGPGPSPAAPVATGGGAPPAATDTDVVQALRDVPGLDAKSALARLPISTEVYLRLLAHFADDVEAGFEHIGKDLEAGDRRSAGERLHRLRGSAVDLGATSFGEAWRAFEAALRDSSADDAALSATFAALSADVTRFVACLRPALRRSGLHAETPSSA